LIGPATLAGPAFMGASFPTIANAAVDAPSEQPNASTAAVSLMLVILIYLWTVP
jgi:hypothetical protein